jgi:hypothetical protein
MGEVLHLKTMQQTCREISSVQRIISVFKAALRPIELLKQKTHALSVIFTERDQ